MSCQSQPKATERADLHLKLGIGFYESGAYPQALAALQKAEALNPQSPQIQNNLGLVYFMRERYDLSEKHIRNALELDPKYTDSRNNLVRVLIEKNDLDKAQIEMDRVFADLTYGGLHRAHNNQGLIYLGKKNFLLQKRPFLSPLNTKEIAAALITIGADPSLSKGTTFERLEPWIEPSPFVRSRWWMNPTTIVPWLIIDRVIKIDLGCGLKRSCGYM